MNTKIMEGLAGASTNMRQTDTTMRVFRDARRRGDLDVMERAMEYTGDYTQKAGEYQETAQEGMEEEAKEVREKVKAQMAEAIQNRKEEQKELEERIQDSGEKTDTVEVSEEGVALLAQGQEADPTAGKEAAGPAGKEAAGSAGMPVTLKEPVFYNAAGTASAVGQTTGAKVSVQG